MAPLVSHLDKTVCLISPQSWRDAQRTVARLNDYAETWATRGVRAWAEVGGNAGQRFGNEVGGIIALNPATS